MRRARWLIWLGSAALLAAMGAGALDQDLLSHARVWVHYAAVLVAVTVALVLWERRPQNRIGPLMTAGVLVGALSELPLVFPASVVAVTVGYAAVHLDAALFVQVTLSYPTGRLWSRVHRTFVAVVYAFAVVSALPLLLFFSPRSPSDPDVWECAACALPVTHLAWRDVSGVEDIMDAVLAVLAAGFIVLLVRELITASAAARRVVLPLLIVALVLAGRFAVQLGLSTGGSPTNFWTSGAMFWIETIGMLAIPIAFATGILWGRSARSAVADLVVRLEDAPPGSVRDALAQTCGDPSLELALWLPARSAYVDARGRPFTLPGPQSGRAVTVLGARDALIAAIVHDPVLLEQPALLRSAGAAARLALENERLQAELRLQLAEVRASRARIVRAGDEERRRLERDLHDGAQQRLLSLGLALQLVRSQLGAAADGAAGLLEEAEAELAAALDELRALAQGIHPAVLTEHGLGPALRTLAVRAALPVTIRRVPEKRLPSAVEAAAYFAVSEALANAIKHACASAVSVSVSCRDGVLRIDVEDDGVGGAAVGEGAGLPGLHDRIQALDGRLTIDSRPGHGTRLRAEIPYAATTAER